MSNDNSSINPDNDSEPVNRDAENLEFAEDFAAGKTIPQLLKRFTGDSLLYSLSSVATQFIGIILIPIFTRVFRPSDFGIIEMIASFIAIAIALCRFGINAAYGRFYYDTNIVNERRTYMGTSAIFLLVWSSFIVLVCMLFYETASQLLFQGDKTHIKAYFIAASCFPLMVLADMFNHLLRFMMQTTKFVILAVGRTLIIFLLSILFVVVYKFSVEGVYWARLGGYAAGLVVGFLLVRDQFNWRFSFAKFKPLLFYGLPFVPSAFLSMADKYIDRWFIAHYLSMADVGLYAITVRISQIFSLFSGGVIMAWPPMAMIVFNQGRAKEFLPKAIFYSTVLGAIMITIISVFAREALIVLTTPDYYEAYKLVPLYSAGLLLFLLTDLNGVGMMITKKTKFWLYATIYKTAAILFFNFLLVPRLGTKGAVYTFLISQIIALIFIHLYSQKIYPLKYSYFRFFKLGIIAGAIIFVSQIINIEELYFLLSAKIALILFLLVSIWSLVLNSSERIYAITQVGNFSRRFKSR